MLAKRKQVSSQCNSREVFNLICTRRARNDLINQISLCGTNYFYVEADRNDKIIKDIASAIESATHAIPGVSLTNATRQNRLNLSVTRSEHQWAQKRHAFHTQFIGLCRVTRRAITIVLFGVFCPRFHVSPSEDHTQRAMSFDQISNHKRSHTKISHGDNQYGIDGRGDVGNSSAQFWLRLLLS